MRTVLSYSIWGWFVDDKKKSEWIEHHTQSINQFVIRTIQPVKMSLNCVFRDQHLQSGLSPFCLKMIHYLTKYFHMYLYWYLSSLFIHLNCCINKPNNVYLSVENICFSFFLQSNIAKLRSYVTAPMFTASEIAGELPLIFTLTVIVIGIYFWQSEGYEIVY